MPHENCICGNKFLPHTALLKTFSAHRHLYRWINDRHSAWLRKRTNMLTTMSNRYVFIFAIIFVNIENQKWAVNILYECIAKAAQLLIINIKSHSSVGSEMAENVAMRVLIGMHRMSLYDTRDFRMIRTQLKLCRLNSIPFYIVYDGSIARDWRPTIDKSINSVRVSRPPTITNQKPGKLFRDASFARMLRIYHICGV